jgi:hypothetical protein
MEPPDLEAHLSELLHRTVANMPLDTHLEQRIHEVVQHRSAPQHRLQLTSGILVALVAAFALAGFVWLRPLAGSAVGTHHQISQTGTVPATSTATAAPTSTPVSSAAATYHGITIVMDAAYADASQTDIFVHFTSTVYQLSQDSCTIIESQLVDSEGHAYDPIVGSGGVDHAEQNYTPLLPSLLRGPQSLTLVVREVALTPTVAAEGVNSPALTGLWQVSFTVRPISPYLQQLQVAPSTHGGVTVQPLTLEHFTGQHPFDTNNNEGAGVRLILRISGLPTPAMLQNAVMFDTASATSSSNVGAHLTFDGAVPSDTALLPGSVQGDTEEVEILYWVPLQFNASTATLTIDRIRLGIPNIYATGPWSFDLAIG